MASALMKSLIPLAVTGINAATNRIQERQRQRASNGTSNMRNTGSRPRPQRAMRSANTNSRNRRGRGPTTTSIVRQAPVATGVTTRTLPTQTVKQRAVEQFTTVAAPSNKFAAYFHTTEVLDELAFPRLSQISSQYQKFNPKALVYQYSPATSTSQPGTIYLGFDPDSTNPLPTNSEQMRGLIGAVSGPVWQPLQMHVPPQLMSKIAKQCYSRRSTSPTDNLNNVGHFIYAVEGVTTTTAVGFMQVGYDIDLIQPKTVIGASTYSSVLEWDVDANDFVGDVCAPIQVLEPGHFKKLTRAPVVLVFHTPNSNPPAFEMDDGGSVLAKSIGTEASVVYLPYGAGTGTYTMDGPVVLCLAHAANPAEKLLPGIF